MNNARLRFDLATDADEPEVRRILRENPMPGAIALSLEREPDSRIAAVVEGPLLHQTIVGRRAGGDGLFGFGTRSARTMYVNGEPRPVGYLGALRLDADHRGNAAALRQGYRLFRELHERDRLVPFYLTSVLAGNANARRLLEANVKGMPTYRFVGELVTLVMRSRRRPQTRARARLRALRGLRVVRAAREHRDAIARLLDEDGRRAAFRPQWTADAPTPGLDERDLRVACDGDRVVGVAAIWNQLAFRQSVVRGYAPWLSCARLAANLLAPLVGRPRLPAVGEPVAAATLSHLAVDSPAVAVALAEALLGVAGRRRIDAPGAPRRRLDHVVVGLPATSPTLAALRRAFGGREFRSRLYVVFWPDGRDAADALDARPAWPEVSLL